jgi:cell division protease FtsH
LTKTTGLTNADMLARAYLAILAAEEESASSTTLQGDTGDPIDRMLGQSTISQTATTVRADYAAAAVLVARAVASIEGLTRRLRRENPVVTFAVGSTQMVDLAAHVLEKCAFGVDASVMEPSEFLVRKSRPVLLVARDGTGKADKPEVGNEVIARAIHAGAPIVGIATDPTRYLPRDLIRAAEIELSVPQIDASAISLVVEAVAGEPPTIEIDEALVTTCDASDLALSIRRDLSPNACIERLRHMVDRKHAIVLDGPVLQELSGFGEAKAWGLELAADLAEFRAKRLAWSDFSSYAALLTGPPGVGKTVLAQAIAKTGNLAMVATSVAEWNDAKNLSGTLNAINESFRLAKKLAPALLYISEFDGISDRSKIRGDYREYWVQIVHAVMENLSGIHNSGTHVIVVASTNRPEDIDPALRRAGRLDRTFVIEKPSVDDLRLIFRYYLRDALPHADLMSAALAAAGGTGADVEAWTRRARSKARRERREMRMDDLLDTIRGGRRPMPDSLLKKVSLHEGGHLVAGVALKIFAPHSVSIADEGGTAKAEVRIEDVQTLADIERVMVVLLAGHAAEEEFLTPEGATAGWAGDSDSDLARATRAAVAIELKLGFGTLGPICFSDHAAELMMHDKTVLGAIQARLLDCYARARRLVAANRDVIATVARRLEEARYLSKTEIEALIGNPDDLVAEDGVEKANGGKSSHEIKDSI